MLHEQSRHSANTSSTYHHHQQQQQQQQQMCVMMTMKSTSERAHHHTLTSVTMSNNYPTIAVRSTSQPQLTAMMSCAASRPRLLPVPVARKSFRIDDILGEEWAQRDDVQGRPPSASSKNTDTCNSLITTDHQTSRQSSDGELTVRPSTDDIIQLHHPQQQQQQRQLHEGTATNERAGHVDAVVLGHRTSSPVAKRSRDSAPDFSSHRRRHVTSGGQSSDTSPSLQDPEARPADLYVSAVRPIQQRQSGVGQHGRLSPSMLLPNVISASHSPCLISHNHHRPQQQQFGHVAENAAVALFGTHHHPLLVVPPPPSPGSTVHYSVDSLNTVLAGRHGSFLPGCKLFCFVHSKNCLSVCLCICLIVNFCSFFLCCYQKW